MEFNVEESDMQKDPNPSDWKRLFDQIPLDVEPRAEQQAAAKRRALESHQMRNRVMHQPKWQIRGHLIMKYRIPHSIVAATVLAAFFWMYHSGSSTALAVEDVVEKLNKATTARALTV